MNLIYLITNLVTGKKYIGFTSYDMKKRIGEHRSKAKAGSMYNLHQSIRKHGWDNFRVDVIDQTEDSNEARVLEIRYILEHKSFGGGYNMTPGGDGGPCTAEKAAAISKAKKGKRYPHMFWITDGVTSKRCRGEIPQGWRRGRISKPGPRLHGTKRPKFPNGYK